MSETTQAITAHHAELARQLRARVAAVTGTPSDHDAEAIVDFLDRELLPHAHGEERHLYPALDPVVAAYARPTETMSIDHEFITRYRNDIASARADLAAARGAASRAAAAARLAHAAALLEAIVELHLAKEERAYLPLLAQHVSDADQATLLRRMHGEGPGEEPVIDVRTMEPPRRHPLIFETFATLPQGGRMIVVASHDPQHLRQQLEERYPSGFSWDYLERGPAWRIRLTKRATGA